MSGDMRAKIAIIVLIACFVFLVGIGSALAATPNQSISVQGVLKNSSGAPVPNGVYSVRFRIYDDATAAPAEPLPCTPTSSPCVYEKTVNIMTSNGVFSTVLDTVPATVSFDKQYFLGIKITGETEEMRPRSNLTYSVYSFSTDRLLPTIWNISFSNPAVYRTGIYWGGLLTTSPHIDISPTENNLLYVSGGGANGAGVLLEGNMTTVYKNLTVNQRVGIGTAPSDALVNIETTGDSGDDLFISLDETGGYGTVDLISHYIGVGQAGLIIGRLGAMNTAYFDTYSGRVGIGTTSPNSMLEINGTGGDWSTNLGFKRVISGKVYDSRIAVAADGLLFRNFNATTNDNISFAFRNSADTNIVTMMGGGNVGIGTTTPNTKLDVRSATTSTSSHVSAGNSDNSSWIELWGGYSGNTPGLFFDSSQPYMKIGYGDTQTGGVTNVLVATNTGNVGIGAMTAPPAKLTITGGTGGNALAFGNDETHMYTYFGAAYSSSFPFIGHMVRSNTTGSNYVKSYGLTPAGQSLIVVGDDISFATKTPNADPEGTNFVVSDNTKLIIKNNGNVGIGTVTIDPLTKVNITGSDSTPSEASKALYIKSGANYYSCFLPGTAVSTREGVTPIEELKVGDKVMSYDLTSGKIVESIVSKTYKSMSDNYYIINERVKVTAEHPFYVVGGAAKDGSWVKVKDLKVGMTLFDGKRVVLINTVRLANEPAEVYNLQVDGYSNYFAEGILVHNKPVVIDVPAYAIYAEGGTDSYFSGKVGIGVLNNPNKLGVNSSVAIGLTYSGISAPINGLIVEGTVGIGTTYVASGMKLDVAGDIHSTTNVITPSLTLNTTSANALWDGGTGGMTANMGTAVGGQTFVMRFGQGNHKINFRYGSSGASIATDPWGDNGGSLNISSGEGYAYSDLFLYGGYANEDSGQVYVLDTLNVAVGNSICLGGVCKSTWPSGVVGSGTANYVPKWTAGTTLGNSAIYESGGNVGIGTTSPGHKLDIFGASDPLVLVQDTRNNVRTIMESSDTFGWVGTASADDFYLGTSSGWKMIINDTTGNIGIGTTTPAVGLMVQKDNGSGYSAWFRASSSSSGVGIGTSGTAGMLQGLTSGGGAATLALNPGGGNVGIGTTSPQTKLHLLVPDDSGLRIQAGESGWGSARVEFYSDPVGSGVEWRPGYIASGDNGGYTGRLDFYTNGAGSGNKIGSVLGMSVVNGNVGIGISNPGRKLDVLGDAWINGNMNAETYAIRDTRNIATTPGSYDNEFTIQFKNSTLFGLPGSPAYSAVMGVAPWSDTSGGPNHEVAFASDGALYHRYENTTSGSWLAWKPIMEPRSGVLITTVSNTIAVAANDGTQGTIYNSLSPNAWYNVYCDIGVYNNDNQQNAQIMFYLSEQYATGNYKSVAVAGDYLHYWCTLTPPVGKGCSEGAGYGATEFLSGPIAGTLNGRVYFTMYNDDSQAQTYWYSCDIYKVS